MLRSLHFMLVLFLAIGGCKFPELPPLETDSATIDSSQQPDGPPTDSTIDSPPIDAAPGPFVLTFGGGASDYPLAATGLDGSVFVAGRLAGVFAIGSFQSSDAGIYLAKIDPFGEVAWARFYTTAGGNPNPRSIAVDSTGNVYVAGNLAGTLMFGASTLSATVFDGLILKVDGNGNPVSHRLIGAGGSQDVFDIAVDGAGDVYVTGSSDATTTYCSTSRANAGGLDVFVAKYSGSTLTCLWDVAFGSSTGDYGATISTDGAGAYVGASVSGALSAGGAVLPSGGGTDVVFARYDASNGAHVWSTRFGNASNEHVSSSAAGDGGIFFAGRFGANSISFGGQNLVSQGPTEVYLVRFSAAGGGHTWSRATGSTGSGDSPGKITFHSTALDYAGEFTGTGAFGGAALNSAGAADAVHAAYSIADGTHLRSARIGGSGDDAAFLSAQTPWGNVVTGNFSGVSYFGTEKRTSTGMRDGFVYRP